MNKKQELNKQVFEETLKRHLKFLGYSLSENDLEEVEDETGNFYRLFLGTFSFNFDDYSYYDKHLTFLTFLREGVRTASIFQHSDNPTEKTGTQNHIKADFNKNQLKANKERIRQLFEVDNNIKITKIAEELGITRQAIYKNLELKKFIDNLRN